MTESSSQQTETSPRTRVLFTINADAYVQRIEDVRANRPHLTDATESE